MTRSNNLTTSVRRTGCQGLTRRKAVPVILAGGLAGSFVLGHAHGAKAIISVERYVGRVAQRALSIITSGRPVVWKKQQFSALAVRSAHIPSIALFSLGPYVRALPNSRRRTYFALVERFVAGLFVTHLEFFKGERVEITGSVRRPRSEFMVTSRVVFADGRSLPVKWRVITRRGRYWIFDVQVRGIWLTILQRSTFVSMIRKAKGDMDVFLDALGKVACGEFSNHFDNESNAMSAHRAIWLSPFQRSKAVQVPYELTQVNAAPFLIA